MYITAFFNFIFLQFTYISHFSYIISETLSFPDFQILFRCLMLYIIVCYDGYYQHSPILFSPLLVLLFYLKFYMCSSSLTSYFQDLKLQKGSVLSEWLYLGGVKAFIDGSLGSNSALFYEVKSTILFLIHLLYILKILSYWWNIHIAIHNTCYFILKQHCKIPRFTSFCRNILIHLIIMG